MSVLNQMFSAGDLDEIRRDLLGASATATFSSVSPSAGETEIKQITSGWHIARKLRQPNRDTPGSVTLILSPDVDLDIEDIREQAVVRIDLYRGAVPKTYKVIEVTSTQQLGGGWVVHCEPIDQTV